MKYFLDNPRARVLIGHQNSNPQNITNVSILYHRAAWFYNSETGSGYQGQKTMDQETIGVQNRN